MTKFPPPKSYPPKSLFKRRKEFNENECNLIGHKLTFGDILHTFQHAFTCIIHGDVDSNDWLDSEAKTFLQSYCVNIKTQEEIIQNVKIVDIITKQF